MSDDLARGRTTESDYVQGMIMELGQRFGVDTPVSRAVIARVKEAEAAKAGLPNLRVEQVLR
jgi:2-dehydropantoate 2-reductase